MNKQDILNTTYEILSTTSAWPSKDNCYRVKVSNSTLETAHVAEYMPIVQYDLIMTVKRIAKSITATELQELLDAIDAFGSMKYNEGQDDVNIN